MIRVKAALVKASKDGVINQNSCGLWQLGGFYENSADNTGDVMVEVEVVGVVAELPQMPVDDLRNASAACGRWVS